MRQEGWVLKKARSGRQKWQRRWLVVANEQFQFFRSKEASRPTKTGALQDVVAAWCDGISLRVFTPQRTYELQPCADEHGPAEVIVGWFKAFDQHSQANQKARLEAKDAAEAAAKRCEDAFATALERTKRGLDAVLAWSELARSANAPLVHAQYLSPAYLGPLRTCQPKEPFRLAEGIRKDVNDAIDHDLHTYESRFYHSLLRETFVIPGAFQDYAPVVELAMRGRCSQLEAQEAAVYPLTSQEQTRRQVTADLLRSKQRLHYLATAVDLPQCSQEDADEKVQTKIQRIKEAILAVRPGVDAQQLAETLCEHLTSTVANFACKTAAQLCFGVAGLILMKPSQDPSDIQRHSDIYVNESGVTVRVPSAWWAVADSTDFWALERDFDPRVHYGIVDAVYTVKYSFSDFEAGVPPFPYITVQRREGRARSKRPSQTLPAPIEVLGLVHQESVGAHGEHGRPKKSHSTNDLEGMDSDGGGHGPLPANRLQSLFRTSLTVNSPGLAHLRNNYSVVPP